jgi:hypothetical protein
MAGIDDIFTNIISRIRVLETLVGKVSSYYNLCVNGGLEVWSAGAGPFTFNGNQIADTWFISKGAGSTISVTKDTVNHDASYSEGCAAIAYTHVAESGIFHSVYGPFIGSPVGISVRVKTSTPAAVRLKVDSTYGNFHSGSGTYETLTLPAFRPTSNPFFLIVALDASCVAYIDNIMCVQGSGPIDYIALTDQDNQRRITDY